jgi:hypothetical protein
VTSDVDDGCQVSSNGTMPRGMTCEVTPVKDLAVFAIKKIFYFTVMGQPRHTTTYEIEKINKII